MRAALQAQRVPGLDARLDEAVLVALEAVERRADDALAGRVHVALGDMFLAYRALLVEYGARLDALEQAREVGR